jgi:hypothetical protein
MASFYRSRPKYILTTSFISRWTCLCTKHQNVALTAKSLKKVGIVADANPERMVKDAIDHILLLYDIPRPDAAWQMFDWNMHFGPPLANCRSNFPQSPFELWHYEVGAYLSMCELGHTVCWPFQRGLWIHQLVVQCQVRNCSAVLKANVHFNEMMMMMMSSL